MQFRPVDVCSEEKGAVMVEMAVSVSLLVGLLMVTFDAFRIAYSWMTLQHAVQEGLRVAKDGPACQTRNYVSLIPTDDCYPGKESDYRNNSRDAALAVLSSFGTQSSSVVNTVESQDTSTPTNYFVSMTASRSLRLTPVTSGLLTLATQSSGNFSVTANGLVKSRF